MHLITSFIVLVTTHAVGLEFPSPFPEEPIQCVYDGVFPGSGVKGQWSYTTGEDGAFTVDIEQSETLEGLLKRQVGDRLQSVTRWSINAQERRAGSLFTTQYQLRAEVLMDQSRTTSVVNTLVLEVGCPGFPRQVSVGERWECSETFMDGWSWSGGASEDTGGEKVRRITKWHYLKDAEVVLADGTTITAAVLEYKDNQGDHGRQWIGKVQPWCPLKTERIKAKRVVGTDVRVGLQKPTGEEKVGADSGAPSSPTAVPSWIMGIIAIVGLILGIGLGRMHKKRIL